MKAIQCKKCSKKWYVHEKDEKKVTICPYCFADVSIQVQNKTTEKKEQQEETKKEYVKANDTKEEKHTISKWYWILGIAVLITGIGSCIEYKRRAEYSEQISQIYNSSTVNFENDSCQDQEEQECVNEWQNVMIADTDQYSIYITGMDGSNYDNGCRLYVAIENKTSDIEYQFDKLPVAVNGVQTDIKIEDPDADLLGTICVPPGERYESSLFLTDLSRDELANVGIEKYSDIEVGFIVRTSEETYMEDGTGMYVHIYPNGRERAFKHERASSPYEKKIITTDRMDVWISDSGYDENGDFQMSLYAINKSDDMLRLGIPDAYFDQKNVVLYFDIQILPGAGIYIPAVAWSQDLAESGVEDFDYVVGDAYISKMNFQKMETESFAYQVVWD